MTIDLTGGLGDDARVRVRRATGRSRPARVGERLDLGRRGRVRPAPHRDRGRRRPVGHPRHPGQRGLRRRPGVQRLRRRPGPRPPRGRRASPASSAPDRCPSSWSSRIGTCELRLAGEVAASSIDAQLGGAFPGQGDPVPDRARGRPPARGPAVDERRAAGRRQAGARHPGGGRPHGPPLAVRAAVPGDRPAADRRRDPRDRRRCQPDPPAEHPPAGQVPGPRLAGRAVPERSRLRLHRLPAPRRRQGHLQRGLPLRRRRRPDPGAGRAGAVARDAHADGRGRLLRARDRRRPDRDASPARRRCRPSW